LPLIPIYEEKADLSNQIISAPEVISALPELPTLADTTKNLYDCHYDKFFVALGGSYHHLLDSLPP
jgi:26S proteasome regulatory subunit N7